MDLKIFAILSVAVTSVLSCAVNNILECPGEPCFEYKPAGPDGCTNCECKRIKSIEGRMLEGDIKLSENIFLYLMNQYKAAKGIDVEKAATTNLIQKWKNLPIVNGKYQVPYVFADNLPQYTKNGVYAAIADYDQFTCVEFIPRTSQSQYLQFVQEGGCWSYVGRSLDVQKISLANRCEKKGIVIHELMHALGFFHEQSRPDRDNYVEILWGNIQNNYVNNFRKHHTDTIDSLVSAYDYGSVMHYGAAYFSKNGQHTIRKADGSTLTGIQRNGFAQSDIDQINLMYDCDGISGTTTEGPETTSVDTPPPKTTAAPCVDKANPKKCLKIAIKNRCTTDNEKKRQKAHKKCPKTCGVC